MPKREAPLNHLENYLPEGSSPRVYEYLNTYKIHLTITRTRKTVLGDYRHATHEDHHRISVNGNLNKYAFLITLIHELGHLITFQHYGNRVLSHGKEWKLAYRHVLEDFIKLELFPGDILETLLRSLHDLPASSCSDINLTRVLKKYDADKTALLVEDLREGAFFKTADGRMFKKGKQIRKRIECTEVGTGKLYLFSPVYEVKPAG
ncbi:MAG: SprT-like domain-containing protein [Bacteroidota bacterium]|nr:SprT-like domain-containing protein [Bacteroidota bacterium]MDP4250567.1 SprT-like domain-containing protein [Bacteroidota bacterium]